MTPDEQIAILRGMLEEIIDSGVEHRAKGYRTIQVGDELWKDIHDELGREVRNQ